jgi:hypothetical protein
MQVGVTGKIATSPKNRLLNVRDFDAKGIICKRMVHGNPQRVREAGQAGQGKRQMVDLSFCEGVRTRVETI